MPHTKIIDLRIPASGGYGLEIGEATIEYDPIKKCLTACTIDVEKRRGLGFDTRPIDCLADSDDLPFDDKPIASLGQQLALNWLETVAGRDWVTSLLLTKSEQRDMALEHQFDMARGA
jgi:hypothetical protein